MKRRTFLLTSLLPVVASAQGSVKRVGILGVAGGGVYSLWKQVFPKEFAALGWVEGRNLELRWYDVEATGPRGDHTNDELRALGKRRAAEMAAAGLDCLVANGDPHARMLQEAARTVPIVVDVPDPIALGFAKTLARPGGNITGLHAGQEEIGLKTVELLRSLMPATKCVTWIGPENFSRSALYYENAARVSGLRFELVTLAGDDAIDVPKLRKEMARLRREGCLIGHASIATQKTMETLVASVFEQRLALAGIGQREGFLLGYDARRRAELESSHRVPAIVNRILRGEKPGDIPFEGPNEYSLVINLKTANRLGIQVPPDILTRADRIVR